MFKAMFLKLSPTDRGYVGFNANKNGVVTPCSLHRMMLLAFDGPRPDVYDGCRHLNDVKHDNVLHNLRYGTQVQNMKDCVRNGTYRHGDVSGEKNPYSKLTEAKVRAIRTAKSDTVEDVHRLAKRFGVTYSTVNNILKGRSWKHVL